MFDLDAGRELRVKTRNRQKVFEENFFFMP
jgi:hypothetical protein